MFVNSTSTGPLTLRSGALLLGTGSNNGFQVNTLNFGTAEGIVFAGVSTTMHGQTGTGTTAITGTSGLTVVAGTLANSYTLTLTAPLAPGLGAVTVNQGTLTAGVANLLQGNNLTVNGSTLGSGTVNLNGHGTTIGVLNGTPGATITNSDGATTLTVSGGSYAGTITGPIALTKSTGSSTLTLTGANTYTGTTVVSAGSLLVNNTTGSGTGTGNVTVTSGAAFGGSGSIGNSLTLGSGSELAVVLNGSGSAQLRTTGNVALGGATLSVTFADGFTPTANSTFTIIDAGSSTITGTFAQDTITVGGFQFGITYNGNSVVLTCTAQGMTPSSTTLTSSVTGQGVTFTATVTGAGGTPAGTVTFQDGATTLATALLSSGHAMYTTSSLAQGSHAVVAVYSGDSSYLASTSNCLTQVVNNPYSTTTTVASSLNPAVWQHSVTFTATVSYNSSLGSLTGTVTFLDGSTTLGSSMLSGSTATYATNSLSVGSHTITAVYAGDDCFAGSTSAAFCQIVKQHTLTWTGTSGSYWSTAGNWNLGVAPITGDDLTFPATGNLTTTDDIPGLTINSITISGTGSGYTISGSQTLTLGGGISNTGGTNTVSVPLVLAGTSTVDVAAGSALTISSVISGTTDGLAKTGTGTLTLTANNTYGGNTTINAGSVVLSGQYGAATSSAFTVNAGGALLLDNAGTNNNNRLGANTALTLAGGELKLTGNGGNATTETIGPLTLASGSSTITVAPNTAQAATLAGSTLTRNPGATVLFRGTNLGSPSVANVANIIFATPPSTDNGLEVGGNLNTTSAPIMPWALGSISANGTGFATSNASPGTNGFDGGFVTYDTDTNNGIRLLNGSEYVKPIDGVPFTTAQFNNQNVFLHGGAYTISNNATETWNSVLMPANGGFFNNASSPGNLTVTSGAISIGDGNYGMGLTTLNFGGAEGVISIGVNDLTMTRGGVYTVITNSGNGTITKTGPNKLTIPAQAINTQMGNMTINGGAVVLNSAAAAGSGTITVSGCGSLINNAGTVANAITLAGGTLGVAGANRTYSGTITLAPGTSSTVTTSDMLAPATGRNLMIGGPITGSGNLTVTTTGSGAGTVTLSGSSSNTYTGTLIIIAGTLGLNNSQGVAISSAGVTINGGTLKNLAGYQISGTATVTVNSGFWNLNGNSETVGTLTGTGGSVLLNGGTLHGNASTYGGSVFSGSGTGLLGTYYRGTDFDTPVGTELDPIIDFTWTNSWPGFGLGSSNYSVRWTGQLVAPASGSYTFYTTSADGVELFLQDPATGVWQTLIDDWTDHAPKEDYSAPITLTAGQSYALRMDYYEHYVGYDCVGAVTTQAVVRLGWLPPNQPTPQPIPTSRLYPAPAATTVTIQPVSTTPPAPACGCTPDLVQQATCSSNCLTQNGTIRKNRCATSTAPSP